MNHYLGSAFAVVLGGFLSACASAPTAASSDALVGRPQQALAQQTQTDALPLAPSDNVSQACALIPEAEQSTCPVQRTAVIGTRELRTPADPRGFLSTPAGAVVYMVAAPGLTREWLGHLVECYQARVASAGNAAQASETCPLAELDASYLITSTGNGFAVAIHSQNNQVAKRVVQVSERLVPGNSSVRTAQAVP